MTQSVQQLPAETVKLITSTQIITSVSTAVKELVENSIDAGAKVIQVRLENYGLDLLEVKDDGSGVHYDNVQRMFLPGYTSKIRRFEDLNQLYSYGFRGEALAALCKVAKIFITTKTSLDTLAMTYDIDATGLPVSSKPTHLNNGTIISVSNLFSNLPVRRLFLSSKKKMSEEIKKTEQVVQSLSLIHPELAVLLIHNKTPIWKKNSVKCIKQSFMQVAGLKVVSKMELINKKANEMKIDLIVPKKNLENVDNLFSNSNLNLYVYVNKRPLICKSLCQVVQEHIFQHYKNLNITQKYAVCFISVEMPPQQMDINLEPNKTKILLKNQTEVIKLIDEILSNYYGHSDFICSFLKERIVEEIINDEDPPEQPCKKLKTNDKSIGEQRNKEFSEKNKDWHLEIINEDCAVNFDINPRDLFPQSLCSQINSENSVLTSEEVSHVTSILNENNTKLVVSTNSKNAETRLVDRDDIQATVTEKPSLPEWPARSKVEIKSEIASQTVLNEKEKGVEEIAAEIEKSAEAWSNEMLKAMNHDKSNESQNCTSNFGEDCEKFDLSMQSVSSQMGKKELKGFTKFARIMRPKIIQEFPNIMFPQVAGILAERWKSLKPDEIKYYEKMAEVVDINRKIHQEEKKSEIPKPQDKSAKHSSNKKVTSLFEKLKQRTKAARPPRKEIPFSVSFPIIQQLQNVQPDECLDEEIKILGQLKPSGNWLYIRGSEIGHVRHQGLQELITSQKMLSNFSVPRKPVDKPILLNEENLGSSLWKILLSLETEFDLCSFRHQIVSDVITKNGFSVAVEKNEDEVISAYITEVALLIPHFGISELKDVLSLYEKNGECGGLASWRPSAVQNFIVNESVRLSQQSTKPLDRREIEEMMSIYHLCLKHLRPVCLHSKDIFVPIYNLEDAASNTQVLSQQY